MTRVCPGLEEEMFELQVVRKSKGRAIANTQGYGLAVKVLRDIFIL